MVSRINKGLVALALCGWVAPAAVADDKLVMKSGRMPEMWLFKASDLIGKEVRNHADEKLGKINELAIDTLDGRISYAVLQFGGFLGVGDKLFAVPWEALRLKPRDKARDNELIFVFNVDKDRLKSAPGFDQNAWPDMADQTWVTTVNTYWEKDMADNPKHLKREKIRTEVRQEPIKLVRRAHKELTGRDIKNARFEDIGDVEDLMIDVISGYSVYLIADFDDKSNITTDNNQEIDDQLVALPWRALQLKRDAADGTKDSFVLNVPENKLRNVPAFPDRNWPNMNDMAWNQRVYRFYDVPGFWDA